MMNVNNTRRKGEKESGDINYLSSFMFEKLKKINFVGWKTEILFDKYYSFPC